ncbi:MAG: hypothetical protein WAN87_07180 [Thermoplasmata archaeon]
MSSEPLSSIPDVLRLRERLDGALERSAQAPGFEGVYLGPWWDLPNDSPRPLLVGWKRAVLRRVAGGGAEHWGHLFLVYSSVGQMAGLEPESDPRLRSPRYGVVRRVGAISNAVELLVRSSHPEGSPLLDRFADESLDRLRREGNPQPISGSG